LRPGRPAPPGFDPPKPAPRAPAPGLPNFFAGPPAPAALLPAGRRRPPAGPSPSFFRKDGLPDSAAPSRSFSSKRPKNQRPFHCRG
jgi:hypothetical protein